MGVTNLMGRPNPPRSTMEKWVYRDSPFSPVFPPGPLAQALCGPWWPYTTPDQPPVVANVAPSLAADLVARRR